MGLPLIPKISYDHPTPLPCNWQDWEYFNTNVDHIRQDCRLHHAFVRCGMNDYQIRVLHFMLVKCGILDPKQNIFKQHSRLPWKLFEASFRYHNLLLYHIGHALLAINLTKTNRCNELRNNRRAKQRKEAREISTDANLLLLLNNSGDLSPTIEAGKKAT